MVTCPRGLKRVCKDVHQKLLETRQFLLAHYLQHLIRDISALQCRPKQIKVLFLFDEIADHPDRDLPDPAVRVCYKVLEERVIRFRIQMGRDREVNPFILGIPVSHKRPYQVQCCNPIEAEQGDQSLCSHVRVAVLCHTDNVLRQLLKRHVPRDRDRLRLHVSV
ncbi:MAG: hypothetical protein A4E57_02462 [Syntrophorhabdaceae bacterium PtaU1.Bin034]|nr:MAG: hypothetical protein A4E57_02462 [Syntrophorhabdaceae bacterium PtaU1.Bin034]